MKLPSLLICLTALTLALGRVLPDKEPSNDVSGLPTSLSANLSIHVPNVGLPKPADNDLWNKVKAKGCSLALGMFFPDKEAGQFFEPKLATVQSPWKNFPDDLVEWAYHPHEIEKEGSPLANLKEFWGITEALQYLGVNAKTKEKGGDNELIQYLHRNDAVDKDGPINLWQQTYPVEQPDGRIVQYPYTGAYFLFSINVVDGVIMALTRRSPKSAAEYYDLMIPDDKLPKLSSSSDMAFAMWSIIAQQQNADMTNINYFFSLSVTNSDTLRVIARALQGGPLRPYPGTEFLATDDAGAALLGTPNGLGFAYFLIQHKAQLGGKVITSINVFHCTDEQKRACLMFRVEPLQAWDSVECASCSNAVMGSQGNVTVGNRLRNLTYNQ